MILLEVSFFLLKFNQFGVTSGTERYFFLNLYVESKLILLKFGPLTTTFFVTLNLRGPMTWVYIFSFMLFPYARQTGA